MQTIRIHTWKCASCDYTQDFEPTVENMKKHFNDDVKENECPSCALQGVRGVSLPKETDPQRKSRIRIFEAGDIEAKRQELMSHESNKVSTGFKEIREETTGEKNNRVSQHGGPDRVVQREFQIFRQETQEEKAARVESKLSGLKEATPEEILAIKAQFEDKD